MYSVTGAIDRYRGWWHISIKPPRRTTNLLRNPLADPGSMETQVQEVDGCNRNAGNRGVAFFTASSDSIGNLVLNCLLWAPLSSLLFQYVARSYRLQCGDFS
jgi:hypothetical protein